MAGEPVQNEGVGREILSFRIDQNELEPCVSVPESGRSRRAIGLGEDGKRTASLETFLMRTSTATRSMRRYVRRSVPTSCSWRG